MSEPAPHHIGTLSPEMALLGMLYNTSGHGYDLHRMVITDLGHVWHLSQSQAYSILKRLESRGDIFAEEVPQEKLPPRQLLQMTSKGRTRFLAWLETPSGGSTRAIRMEFITRLYFLRQYFPEKIEQAFDLQRDETKKQIRRLEIVRSQLPTSQTFNHMSLNLRLKQMDCVLEWLADCQAEFQTTPKSQSKGI
jgi:DNA-binding PadR family transcriptional regulator